MMQARAFLLEKFADNGVGMRRFEKLDARSASVPGG